MTLLQKMKDDIQTVAAKDPAAQSTLEIILCYPGLHALWLHRLAHGLWKRKLRLFSRLLAHFNRWLTGIDIHPGAEIGTSVFIDHGAGVVIGETAVIGEGCLLYQGAVLGGTSRKRTKRHPTLGRNVEVGAGAIILGPVSVGAGARIGAGSVVIRDVPAGATVIGVPGRVAAGFTAEDIQQLQHGKLPDPVAEAINWFMAKQEKLEERIAQLENLEGISATINQVWEEKKEEILKEFLTGEKKFDQGEGI
jgi:serine O-acetyltransferase